MFNYPLKLPFLYKKILPYALTHIKTSQKKIYLTFDDGPHPQVTPWVLAELEKYQAKATFFCVGKNIKKYPQIFQEIINQGHQLGNHTYTHENAWNTSLNDYLKSIEKTDLLLKHSSNLFRPPYGKITPKMTKELQKKGYQLVLWSWIVGDYNPKLKVDKVTQKLITEIKAGDILVFHDSQKAFTNLKKILPKILEKYHKQAYFFDKIN